MVHLTRRYRISAAHRLHNDALSPEDNARLYGKCNNPAGHGHDYILEVTVAGEVDPRTGMVMDIGVLDRLVERDVLDRFDHKHLNLDVENFRDLVPTTENLCLEIYRQLAPNFPVWSGKSDDEPDGTGREDSTPGARLLRVRIEETPRNFFEYEGPGAANGIPAASGAEE
ncbi:MAG TPA: 6-carboxytetrahydropterin synthase [Terriglobia bacterium]|jgi:6-pyruvoyltetrahydropterin/6-carboxytetrahydropterin synthase|nr:6-carboxytetrahydropterin synthase [Terriglobia bacterium]